MDDLRNQIFDTIYRSGPQTVEQLVTTLSSNTNDVTIGVCHEWFKIQGDQIFIATANDADNKKPQ